ncbi:E3 ubiquitin-protein ligase SIAH1 [Zootermopsis nevadensis]|uniref:RING-type E3 ubiquitin transferase n=2 Tax=Zootermopsis nevadensis TaxID=136037 RepID=A0A067QRK1_ZOONE|nr:E3 ubiquitin-protein ligase SIAH1 [Zootermopsis nevadensis]
MSAVLYGSQTWSLILREQHSSLRTPCHLTWRLTEGMEKGLDILAPVSSVGDLLEYLKCPRCSERMEQPIAFCKNGHNICGACKDAMGKCPICGHPFTGTTNIGLENVSVWSGVACPNVDLGCKIVCPSELMTDHIATCTYKKATCPLDKLLSIVCPWEGLLKDMAAHCRESHQSRFREGSVFKSSSINDAVNIILNDDEIFIYHKLFKGGKLYCAVEKVGISQTPYSATFILDTLSGLDRIALNQVVNVVSENTDVPLKSGKFLKLNDKLLKRFICDGKLALQVVISEVNLET